VHWSYRDFNFSYRPIFLQRIAKTRQQFTPRKYHVHDVDCATPALPPSQNFNIAAITNSPKRLAIAMKQGYPDTCFGGDQMEPCAMLLHAQCAPSSAVRVFTTPPRCPHCGDWMVAPVMSEFVEGDEIRHHWECDACGEASSTSVSLTLD